MRLKKDDEYMSEQDQHKMESEKDNVIQNKIDDLNSNNNETTDINSIKLSADQIDSLRNANNIRENVINEGNVKNLLFNIRESLRNLIDQVVINSYKSGKDFEDFEDSILKEYSEKIFDIMVEEPIGESLTEQEDIPQIILDQEETRRFKETKDTLDGKSKEVYDTTANVERNLEKESTDDLQDKEEPEDSTTFEINDFVIEESDDFIIEPSSPEFKLMKECLGDDINYSQLRNHLKETSPGWENHTSDILDIWGLIK